MKGTLLRIAVFILAMNPALCFADGGVHSIHAAKLPKRPKKSVTNAATPEKIQLPAPWPPRKTKVKTRKQVKLPKPHLTEADLTQYQLAKPNIIKTSATKKTPPLHPQSQVSKSWFIKPSIGVMRVNLPRFQYGTVDNIITTPVYNFRTSFSKYVPGVEAGHYSYNNHFLPSIFGNTTALSFAIYHIKDEQTNFVGNNISAFLWGIDGRGPLTALGELGFNTTLNSVIFKRRHELTHILVQLQGYKPIATGPHVSATRSTSIAFIYRNFDQNYNLDGESGGIPVLLEEKSRTNYYGLQLGNKLTLATNAVISTFIKGTATLLYVNTNFHGAQTIIFAPSTTQDIDVANTDNRVSYALMLVAGINLHPTQLPIIITLKGGAEYLAYVPEIINPISGDSRPAHVVGQSEVNPFGDVSVTVPF